jgi:beta-galactosidase
MNRIVWFLLISIIGFSINACSRSKLVSVNDSFNEGWQFYRSPDTAAFPSEQTNWEMVVLPHTARLEPLTVKNQWQGVCFYRKEFAIDPDYRNKNISLQFDAAMNVADVWVNGKKAAHHMGGYLPFVVDLSDLLSFDSTNTILVRLDNRDNPITGPKPLSILDFNMYGGLYRSVSLIVKEKIHLSNPVQANVIAGGGVFFSTLYADKQRASFTIKSHIKNESDKPARIKVAHQLLDESGKVMASLESPMRSLDSKQDTELVLSGEVDSPRLWSPSAPNLYTLRTEVYDDGRLTDIQINRIGIRTIQITPEGLWLNGEKTFLRGVNRHQEYPYIGYALSDAAQYRDAYKIKQAGFDFMRSSHYPMSPAFLDACDELGILVLDAILGWQYFGDKEFEKLALQSSRELIRRDRNHPCILAWELSINETDMPKLFTDSAQRIAHEEFPGSSCYSAGWVRQSYDIYIEARQHRHGLFPEKPLLVSEYGDWEYFAQNAGFNQQNWNDLLDAERNSRQPRFAGEKRMLQQALNIQEAHNDNLSTHAFADAYWVMFDYNRGMAPEQEYSGIMDIFRIPKYSYYFFKSQRSYSATCEFAEPVLYIASFWQPGESRGVRVFSNCEEVELTIDGTHAGRQKPDQNSLTTNLAHPPFSFDVACKKPGIIKATGFIDGKPAAEYIVRTPSFPDHISIEVDESGKRPERNDIIFVYAGIQDKYNTVVYNDSSEVSFQIEGAQIIGPSKIRAQAGIAAVLVQTGSTSEIKVIAEADKIKAGNAKIKLTDN